MTTLHLEVPDDLIKLLREFNRPASSSAVELIVMELYRREIISSGKAAELLGIRRGDFIRLSSLQGIPYFRMSKEDLEADLKSFETTM